MMFIEILVWATLLGVFAGVVLVLDYWGHLLREQDSYTRDELIDLYRIILRQFENLTSRGETALNYLALLSGIAVAWALTLFGGLLSPDITIAPDHAEDQIPNYFFQSILFPLILHIVWPSMKDVASDQGGPDGFLSRLLATELPFFFSLTIALGAINLAVWGVHHHMSFIFCAINAGLCFIYAGYRLHTAEPASEYAPGSDYGESYDDNYGDAYDSPAPETERFDDFDAGSVELGEDAGDLNQSSDDRDPY
ncbi:MAG: hypothetical protein NXI24_03575 [bacterium]|nr:hypothetical protein [bacterium]